MRIPNVQGAANFAGVSSQSLKETSDASKSKASAAEAVQQSGTAGQIEDVAASEETGDRDAQERYDGPDSRGKANSQNATSSSESERQAPSLFDLPVADDSPPPSLDTQA